MDLILLGQFLTPVYVIAAAVTGAFMTYLFQRRAQDRQKSLEGKTKESENAAIRTTVKEELEIFRKYVVSICPMIKLEDYAYTTMSVGKWSNQGRLADVLYSTLQFPKLDVVMKIQVFGPERLRKVQQAYQAIDELIGTRRDDVDHFGMNVPTYVYYQKAIDDCLKSTEEAITSLE